MGKLRTAEENWAVSVVGTDEVALEMLLLGK